MLRNSDAFKVTLNEANANSNGGDTITLTKDQLTVLLKALQVDSNAKEFSSTEENHINYRPPSQEAKRHVINVPEFKAESTRSTPAAASYRQDNFTNPAKNDTFEEWNPWGKPGGGAPLKRQCNSTGNLVHFRGQSPSWSHTDSNGCRFGATAVARVSPQKPLKQNQAGKYIPMAVASSLPFGNSDDVVGLQLYKQEEKKRWLADLERQREEQRKKKEQEKQHRVGRQTASLTDLTNVFPSSNESNGNVSLNSTSSDQMTSSISSSSPVQNNSSSPSSYDHLVLQQDNHSNGLYPYPVITRESPHLSDHRSIKTPPEHGMQAQGFKENNLSYLRGQNIPIDPDVKIEKEEKKSHAIRYQLDLQAQIEQKAKMKKEEKLKIQREEALAEQRFNEQQLHLKQQFELEQQKAKEKQLAEEEKHKKIAQEMEKAKAEAEAERRALKRLNTPLKSGVVTPDIHQFTERSSTVQEVGSVTEPTDKLPSISAACSPCFNQVQTATQTEEPYTTNRLLTPTVYRTPNVASGSLFKEFGTQTDNFDVDNSSKAKKKLYDKSESLSSAKSDYERPKWGANRPKTMYRKQSEKDPYYEKKRSSYARERRRAKNRAPADSDSSSTIISSENHRNSKETDVNSKVFSTDSGFTDEPMHKAEENITEHNDIPNVRILSDKLTPVPRQDRILQQLSDLRQGLLQKQIELQKLIKSSKSAGI